MTDCVIMSDSTCDFDDTAAKELGVEIVPLNLSFDGQDYKACVDEIDDFYNKLRGGAQALTSSPNVETFTRCMEKVLKKGKDILYIGLSSALSSTYQNSCIAAKELKSRYPDRNIFCVDSKAASVGLGLLLYHVTQAKDKSITQLKEYAEELSSKLRHWFTVEDMSYLKRGGRISATQAPVGSALHINPILRLDEKGKLAIAEKVRGRKAAIKALFDKISKSDVTDQTVMICHGDCVDQAAELAAMIKDRLQPKKIHIGCLRPIVAAHVGPGALGVVFVEMDKDKTCD